MKSFYEFYQKVMREAAPPAPAGAAPAAPASTAPAAPASAAPAQPAQGQGTSPPVPKDQKLVQQVATLIKSNINNFEGDNKKFMADVLQKLTAPKTTAAAAQPAQQAANVAQQAAAAAPAAPAAPGAPQK